jgi:hypothetical protein
MGVAYQFSLLGCGLVIAGPASAQENASALFGTSDKDGAGLIAIIYDLKQTQSRQPSQITAETYPAVVQDFLSKGWDEVVLNKFFRVTRPLYSTQIFIPGMDAGAAPKAYGVDTVMKASCWVIHYKGQVSPPEDGTYRFVGYADDALAVAVDNKTVCVGARHDMQLEKIWKTKEKQGAKAFNGNLSYGEWITLKKDQPVDLDVLVGERPGGDFCAFLLYQKQGDTYESDKNGQPVLPVFQLAPLEIPGKGTDKAPPFSRAAETWTQHR